jgi:hypothetical protein
MGARGYNAGGFAYMATVTCPRCGSRRKLGGDAVRAGRLACMDTDKCDKRRAKGKYLHRISPPNTEAKPTREEGSA